MNTEPITPPQTPPKTPVENCKICHKPIEFTLYDDWQFRLGRWDTQLSDGLIKIFCFSASPHLECASQLAEQEEKDRIAEHQVQLMEEHQEEINMWYASPSLPLDARTKTFESYQNLADNKKTIDLLKKWSPHDDFGFLLYGPSGTGKSHLGFSLMKLVFDAQLKLKADDVGASGKRHSLMPHYESVANMLSKLRGTSGDLSHRVMSAPILFLDDLGAESITDWSREIFFRLFDHRLNRRLPVIVTSNLSLNELKERLHERIVSRIMGLCIPLQVNGNDYRKNVLSERVRSLASR